MADPRSGHRAPAPDLLAAASTMTRERLRFAIPVCAVSFGGFLVITILAGFTDVLNATVAGPVTWLVMLMVLGFPVVAVCAVLYARRAAGWDVRTAEVLATARTKAAADAATDSDADAAGATR